MADSIFDQPRFQDPVAARKYLESVRWPDGPVCPHCGSVSKDHYALHGEAQRDGLYKCKDCREQFTVTVGTVFERSKIPLHKWVMLSELMCASKKGISSKQVQRMLGVTYKTAWFMTHRMREAMTPTSSGKLGGNGSAVEADETYVGGKERNKHASKRESKNIGGMGKQMVLSLVERKGKVRSFHVSNIDASNLRPMLKLHLDAPGTRLMTDGERQYQKVSDMFQSHEHVNHGIGEYVRGDAHCNTAEGYFSILKRGIIGTFHHISAQHLQRYCAEFDFRYNHRETRVKDADGKWAKAGFSDTERTVAALKGIGGKRLTYRRTHATA